MKTSMKVLAVTALLSTIALTGCKSDREGYPDDGWSSENVGTPEGTVTCILFDGYDGDTISCDWQGLRDNK